MLVLSNIGTLVGITMSIFISIIICFVLEEPDQSSTSYGNDSNSENRNEALKYFAYEQYTKMTRF